MSRNSATTHPRQGAGTPVASLGTPTFRTFAPAYAPAWSQRVRVLAHGVADEMREGGLLIGGCGIAPSS